MSVEIDFDDFLRLKKKLKKMDKLPQKCVTKAAKKGAGIMLKAAKKSAPERTGNLKKGLIIKGEKLRKRGKKVYQVTFTPKMNDIFRKPIKEPGKYGGESKTAYYPSSLIFGFKTAKGKIDEKEKKSRQEDEKTCKVPNDFLTEAVKENKEKANAKMIEVLEKEIDKEWAKK